MALFVLNESEYLSYRSQKTSPRTSPKSSPVPTVRLKLWLSKRLADGRFPVYLTLHHKGQRSVIATPVHLRKGEWNDRTGEVRKSVPAAAEMNRELQRMRDSLQGALTLAVLRADPDPIRSAKKAIGGHSGAHSFIQYAYRAADTYEDRGQVATAMSSRVAIAKLEAVAGSVTFGGLTHQVLRRFVTKYTAEGNKGTTVDKNIRSLRAIWRTAMREGYADHDPFDGLKIKKRPAERSRLTYAEVKELEALEVDGLLADVRRWWLFSFYSGGMRFSDVATLTRDRVVGGRLVFAQRKTGGRLSVQLVEQAIGILAHYENDERCVGNYAFPIMRRVPTDPVDLRRELSTRNALVNKYLKMLRPGLTFHVARHSIADHIRKMGLSVYDISKALGHSSIRETETYLSGFDVDALGDRMQGLF